MSGLPITLVAGVARNGALGFQNTIPWRAPSDLKRFKEITWGRPLIMGRKTYESIGKPLPGRETIVVSHAQNPFGGTTPDHVHLAHDFAGAVDLANEVAQSLHCAEIVLAGGAELYRQGLPLCAYMRLTVVDCAPQADAFFPEVDWADWRELRREKPLRGPRDEVDLEYVDYQRA